MKMTRSERKKYRGRSTTLTKTHHSMSSSASSAVVSGSRTVAKKGLLVGAVAVVVIVYGVALSMLRKSEVASGVTSNPMFESLATTSVAALLAAAVSTAGLDAWFDSSKASMLGKFALRFVSYTLSFALVMLATTQISGRLPAALAASARSPDEAAMCAAAVTKANADLVAKYKAAGLELPKELPVSANDGGVASQSDAAALLSSE